MLKTITRRRVNVGHAVVLATFIIHFSIESFGPWRIIEFGDFVDVIKTWLNLSRILLLKLIILQKIFLIWKKKCMTHNVNRYNSEEIL